MLNKSVFYMLIVFGVFSLSSSARAEQFSETLDVLYQRTAYKPVTIKAVWTLQIQVSENIAIYTGQWGGESCDNIVVSLNDGVVAANISECTHGADCNIFGFSVGDLWEGKMHCDSAGMYRFTAW